MEILTSRVQYWRSFKDDPRYLFLDVTRKSGDHVFAPSQQLLNAFKYRGLEERDYKVQYLIEMRRSYRENEQRWNEVLNSDKTVVLACYCEQGKFCHRLLLADIMKKITESNGKEFNYIGEYQNG